MALEYLLRTNEYNKPHVLSGRDALATKLLMLLNMKPGTDPLHPDMYIDIVGRYRFCLEEDVDELQEEVNDMVETYINTENLLNIQVEVEWDEGEIHVKITVDDTAYNFKTSDDGVVFALDDVMDKDPDDDGDDSMDIPEEVPSEEYFDNAPTYPGDEGAIEIYDANN